MPHRSVAAATRAGRRLAAAAGLTLLAAAPLSAQAPTGTFAPIGAGADAAPPATILTPLSRAPDAAPAPAPGEASGRVLLPSADALAAGVRSSTHEISTAEAEALMRRRQLEQSHVLMIVGGTALVIGLIIEDDAGAVLAIGGAVVGLIGLYQWLQTQ